VTAQIKILSCDGGGIRGLLTTIILEALEAEIKAINPTSSLSECFDVFAGTSTGSIIACGLANGFTATKIREFYEQKGGLIFPRLNAKFWLTKVLDRMRQASVSQPLFEAGGLESVLRSPDVFPDSLLFGGLQKQVLVVSYDTYNRKAIVFKTKSEKCANLPVWQVCRASAAAPVAFPGFLLKDAQFHEGHKAGGHVEGDLERQIPAEGLPLIDGGVLANNPVLCAIAEQLRQPPTGSEETNLNPLTHLLVASFGTGQSGRRITPKNVQNWGAFSWSDLVRGVPLYQVCADGSADVIDYLASSLLNQRYQRFQPVFKETTSVFQADEKNLQKIRATAESYLAENNGFERQRLKDLANQVTPKPPSGAAA
jgi:patatin-like phospholipase/acyl hydrolase